MENATAAETAEDVKDEVQEPVMREKLNMDDKKWNKQYGLARVKMGNLKPGAFAFPQLALSPLTDLVLISSL